MQMQSNYYSFIFKRFSIRKMNTLFCSAIGIEDMEGQLRHICFQFRFFSIFAYRIDRDVHLFQI